MLKHRISQLQLAMMLLTRIPVGELRGRVPSTASSAWAWPLAGLAIALPSALVYLGLSAIGFGAQIAALGCVAMQIFLSGAMHEDGLADMADGLGGGTTKARKLEIMRDSRIGSYGALALIFAVAFQVSFISALETPEVVIPAAIGIAMVSRGLLPFWLRQMPPARDDGLGRTATGIPKAGILVAAGIGFLGLLPLGVIPAMLVFAGVLLGGALICLLAIRQINGQTGDVIGAIQKLSEIFGWAVLLAWSGRGLGL